MALIRPRVGSYDSDIAYSLTPFDNPVGTFKYKDTYFLIRNPWQIVSMKTYNGPNITLKLIVSYGPHHYSIVFCHVTANPIDYFWQLEQIKFDMIVGQLPFNFGLMSLNNISLDRVLMRDYVPVIRFRNIKKSPTFYADLLIVTMETPLVDHYYGYNRKYVGYVAHNVDIISTVPFDCKFNGIYHPGMLISFTYRDSTIRTCLVFYSSHEFACITKCETDMPQAQVKAANICPLTARVKAQKTDWIIFFYASTTRAR